jgi:peptidyl-prolyl cis-trans isomerase SurA
LERLILTKLQLRAAERDGIVVDDPTLNAAMESLARQNNLSLSQLRESVEKDGMSFANFREEIRREILFTRLRQRVVDSQMQISDQEVDNSLASLPRAIPSANVEYHVAHILIALPEGPTPQQVEAAQEKAQGVLQQLRQGADFKQLAAGVSADQQALEGGDLGWRTAERLPSLFADVVPRLQPGQISDLIRSPSGFHIVKLLEVRNTAAAPGTPTATVPAADQVYHLRHVLIKAGATDSDTVAQQRAQQLYERLQRGENFAALARSQSEDTLSATKGGDLGWISPARLPPEFQPELSKLKVGEFSRPFKTPYGWHIVQLVEPPKQDTEEDRRTRTREALFKRRIEEEWNAWLRRLRDEAYVEIRLPKTTTGQ